MRYSIVFLATPAFTAPVLERLHAEHRVIAVVTQPDKPVGRKQVMTPPGIVVTADKLSVPVLQPEKASEIPSLVSERVDFLVTFAYGQYLPEAVLTMPTQDALNIHPSMLPLYRGATPMKSALLNGDTKTGVSIMRMVDKMDEGPVFSQQQFPLPPGMTNDELEAKAADMGADMVCHVINNIHSMSPQEQDHSKATYCTKISKADGQVDWETDSATQLSNKLRAFTPWPGVFTQWEGQKLSLLAFTPHPEKNSGHPAGTVYQEGSNTFIQCDEGSIDLKEVQLAGKKPAGIKAFLNGKPDFIGSHLKTLSA